MAANGVRLRLLDIDLVYQSVSRLALEACSILGGPLNSCSYLYGSLEIEVIFFLERSSLNLGVITSKHKGISLVALP